MSWFWWRGSAEKQKRRNKELLAAVEAGDLFLAEKLLSQNADINYLNARKKSLLFIACGNQDSEMVKLLAENDPRPNFHYKDRRGRTALETVQENKKIASIIAKSIETSEEELLKYATRGRSVKVRKLILEGVLVNCTDDDGRTPLHLAAVGNHRRTVEALLNTPGITQPSVKIKDKAGLDCLDVATNAGNSTIEEIIRNYALTSSTIDRFLQDEKKEQASQLKLLVLGAGEAGKTTVVKQLKNKYASNEPTKQEIAKNRALLMRNTIDAVQLILQQVELAEFKEDELAEKAKLLLEKDSTSGMEASDADVIKLLLEQDSVKKLLDNSDFYVPDSATYYFDNMHRFCDPEFESTEEDFLMARARTTGVNAVTLSIPPRQWEVIDVGGQRSERKKWINFFDNVDAILFVVNLAGYAKVCFEDQKVNRMSEAMKVFYDISNNELFKDTPLYIFFNKKDLFEEYLRTKPLKNHFEDYEGEDTVQEALPFIRKKFSELMPDGKQAGEMIAVSARFRKEIIAAFSDVTKDVEAIKKGKK